MPDSSATALREAPPAKVWGNGAIAVYVLLIIYASLHPFLGWSERAEFSWHDLWPRYHTEFDDLINVAAYAPLGFLIASVLSRRRTKPLAFLLAVCCGCALSLSMETLQWFLPGRVASLLDWLCNTLGTTLGALLCLSSPGQRLRALVHDWRARFFLLGATVDAGLILILVWLLAQTNPSVPFFEAGNMVNRLTTSWQMNPYDPLLLIPQVVSVGFNVCGFALFVSILLYPQVRSVLMVLAILAAGLVLKFTAAGLMLKAPLMEQWLGPASVLGLIAGFAAALPLLHCARKVRLYLAVLVVFAGALMSKMASIYDAFDKTLRLFDWPYGQLSNFASLTRYLGEVWPFLALLFLAVCFVRQPGEDLQ
jgi:VanZ family protein